MNNQVITYWECESTVIFWHKGKRIASAWAKGSECGERHRIPRQLHAIRIDEIFVEPAHKLFQYLTECAGQFLPFQEVKDTLNQLGESNG